MADGAATRPYGSRYRKVKTQSTVDET